MKQEKTAVRKGWKLLWAALMLMAAAVLWGGVRSSAQPNAGEIYLYGETHGIRPYIQKEFELWEQYYQQGMRHLFIEYPYYTAEFLNLWMQQDSDSILYQVFGDLSGTACDTQETLEFFQKIKARCPETVFHGTDVGHQYQSTGARYLAYLEENGLAGSQQAARAREVIQQGEYYYQNNDPVYRENKMAENFLREYAALEGESIMGIYGSAHTDLEGMDYLTGTVPCMANQLKEKYGEKVHAQLMADLVEYTPPTLAQLILPAEGQERAFVLNGREYPAVCLGWQDLTAFPGGAYLARSFWRMDGGAYEVFKNSPLTGNVLPCNNFPTAVETGQVFVVEYVLSNGGTQRHYLRADGTSWQGKPATVGFLPI